MSLPKELTFYSEKRYNAQRGDGRMENIEEMVKKLPPELRQEVEDFVNFLIEKKGRRHGRKLRQDWAGALRDYRDKYTSLELQQKASEWHKNTI